MTIESDFFIASGVVFRNDAPRPEEKRNPQGKISELSTGNMAPALRVVARIQGDLLQMHHRSRAGRAPYMTTRDCTTLSRAQSTAPSTSSSVMQGPFTRRLQHCLHVRWIPRGPAGGKAAVDVAAAAGFSFKTCTIAGDSFVYSYTDIQRDLIPLIISGSDDGPAGAKFQINRYHYRTCGWPHIIMFIYLYNIYLWYMHSISTYNIIIT